MTARWPAEVVEAVAEAIHVGWHDNYLDKHPWASLTDYQRGEFRLMARAALAVVPPDPVIAEIRELFADTEVHSAVLMQRVANVLEGDHPEAFIGQIESDRQQVRNLVGDWFNDYNLADDFLGMLNRSGFQIERKADAIARLLDEA